MKKLNKLSINLNKVMKNEELVNLRGGYVSYGSYFSCSCTSYNPPYNTSGWCTLYLSSVDMANDLTKACASGGTCSSVSSC
jgi:natural product precursor